VTTKLLECGSMSERPEAPPTDSVTDRLTVSTRALAGMGVVVLVGELDHDTAPVLAQAADSFVCAGVPKLVVDCSGLGFCDSSGLNTLLKARQWMADGGGRFFLAAPSRQLRRLLDLTGAASVFETLPDVATVAEA
jgi:anti-anti-sigma factor